MLHYREEWACHLEALKSQKTPSLITVCTLRAQRIDKPVACTCRMGLHLKNFPLTYRHACPIILSCRMHEYIHFRNASQAERKPNYLTAARGRTRMRICSPQLCIKQAKLGVTCVQDALRRGIMSAAELRQWLALAAKPILGALSRRATL